MADLPAHATFTSGFIYMVDTPKERVSWSQLEPLLKQCGRVKLHNSIVNKKGPGGHKRIWKLEYETATQAEMVMITLNHSVVPHITPTYRLYLSAIPDPPATVPSSRSPLLFFKCAASHPLLTLSAEDIFVIFRPAGPIKSIRRDVHIGYDHPVTTLGFYSPESGPAARELLTKLLAKKRWRDCKLQLYDPYILYVVPLPVDTTPKDLDGVFQKTVSRVDFNGTRSRVAPSEESRNFGFVEFDLADQATSALAAHATDLRGWKISVRCQEYTPIFSVHGTQPLSLPSSAPEAIATAKEPPVQTSDKDPPTTSKPDVKQPPEPARQPDANTELRKRAARERLQDARQLLKKLRQDIVVAQQATDDAKAQETTAQSKFHAAQATALAAADTRDIAQAALRSAAEARQAAVAAEEEARRKRQAAELAERVALEASAVADGAATVAANSSAVAERTYQSTSFLLGAVSESLKTVQGKVQHAEEAEREAERALLVILSEPSGTPKPPTSATPAPPSDRGNPKSAPAASPAQNRPHPSSEPATPSVGERNAAPSTPPSTTSDPQARKAAEEERWRAELVESIRKMNEMRLAEKNDAAQRRRDEEDVKTRQRKAEEEAAAAAARAKSQKEEQERRAREDQLRREREEREKAEWDQQDAKTRQKRWMDATNAQVIRCSQRDVGQWPVSKNWTARDALDRFTLVSTEFDESQYSLELPLVVAAVPWPILASPYQLDPLKLVQWQTVEDFFKAVRPMLTVLQFGALLEKSQKRFHPDRWRSRRLLTTVLNDDLKEMLEATGMVVSQAINHLVTEWRKK